jgi:hypothetical protein
MTCNGGWADPWLQALPTPCWDVRLHVTAQYTQVRACMSNPVPLLHWTSSQVLHSVAQSFLGVLQWRVWGCSVPQSVRPIRQVMVHCPVMVSAHMPVWLHTVSLVAVVVCRTVCHNSLCSLCHTPPVHVQQFAAVHMGVEDEHLALVSVRGCGLQTKALLCSCVQTLSTHVICYVLIIMCFCCCRHTQVNDSRCRTELP